VKQLLFLLEREQEREGGRKGGKEGGREGAFISVFYFRELVVSKMFLSITPLLISAFSVHAIVCLLSQSLLAVAEKRQDFCQARPWRVSGPVHSAA